MMKACAEQELLLGGLVDGELDAANAALVEAHAARCEGCRDELERIQAVAACSPGGCASCGPGGPRWPRISALPELNRPGPPTTNRVAGLAGAGACRCDRRVAGDGARCSRGLPSLDRTGAGLQPRPLASARPSDRCANHQPAYRETMVQRPDRFRAAGARTCRPGLSACRGATGFDRRKNGRGDRLSSEAAHREPLRLARPRKRRALVREGRFRGRGMEPQRAALAAVSDIPAAELQQFQQAVRGERRVSRAYGSSRRMGERSFRSLLGGRPGWTTSCRRGWSSDCCSMFRCRPSSV